MPLIDFGKISRTVDCIGLHCPMPAVKLSLGLSAIKVGEILELIATDEATQKDIPAIVEHNGNELLKSFSAEKENIADGKRHEIEFHYIVRRLK